MNHTIKETGNNRLYTIIAASFLVPTIYFFGIGLPFKYSLGRLGFTLGSMIVFCVLFFLGAWGIRTEKIKVNIGWRTFGQALIFTLLGWLIFAAIQFAIGVDNLPNLKATISKLAVWPLALAWARTWLFTGFAEELLFRGYILTKIKRNLENLGKKHSALLAVLIANGVFALWHIPDRLFQVVTGQLDIPLALLSLLVIFVMAAGFAYLYLRTNNLILVGMVHGLVDLPLVGDQNMASILIIAVIMLVEMYYWAGRRSLKTQAAAV